ncbi:hypothetical protein [Lyngbya confervoides]|uniref:Uncharacterized protein n=1 Tax=Lyngbya confervoides BDU141951 TaxID=1574623 RepID=A0ABD4T669_9CYAN|nr:hypothetical protein [Lyngbya confervoides]MCM1983938.1 hypothetical protein [Lyngbya confervoides BDU141951]
MALSSVLSFTTGVARADDNDWFDEVTDRCERISGGYFCQRSDRKDRDQRNWPRNDRFERNWPENRQDWGYYNPEGKLYKGALIPTVSRYGDRILIDKNDSESLTLLVERDIRSDTTRNILIPKGSQIEGRLRSHDGGIRYEADYVRLPNGRRYNLNARSETIYPRYRQARRGPSSDVATVILGTILSRELGRRQGLGEVLGRGGDLFGRSRDLRRRDRDDLVAIDPNRDLDLRLTKDFEID